jgi:methylmalonyl-CoA/ethylmalonyl-CoA epimerase
MRTGAEGTLGRVFGRNAFREIDHIGVAVADLDAAIAVHRDTYGMPLVHRETIDEQGVDAALLDVGDSHVELLAPLGDDTPVGRFLAKRGPGLHHVAYRVDDVAAALEQLREAGVRLIDETPRTGIRGSQVAFLHPSASGGVLTELVQPQIVAMDGDVDIKGPRDEGPGRLVA